MPLLQTELLGRVVKEVTASEVAGHKFDTLFAAARLFYLLGGKGSPIIWAKEFSFDILKKMGLVSKVFGDEAFPLRPKLLLSIECFAKCTPTEAYGDIKKYYNDIREYLSQIQKKLENEFYITEANRENSQDLRSKIQDVNSLSKYLDQLTLSDEVNNHQYFICLSYIDFASRELDKILSEDLHDVYQRKYRDRKVGEFFKKILEDKISYEKMKNEFMEELSLFEDLLNTGGDQAAKEEIITKLLISAAMQGNGDNFRYGISQLLDVRYGIVSTDSDRKRREENIEENLNKINGLLQHRLNETINKLISDLPRPLQINLQNYLQQKTTVFDIIQKIRSELVDISSHDRTLENLDSLVKKSLERYNQQLHVVISEEMRNYIIGARIKSIPHFHENNLQILQSKEESSKKHQVAMKLAKLKKIEETFNQVIVEIQNKITEISLRKKIFNYLHPSVLNAFTTLQEMISAIQSTEMGGFIARILIGNTQIDSTSYSFGESENLITRLFRWFLSPNWLVKILHKFYIPISYSKYIENQINTVKVNVVKSIQWLNTISETSILWLYYHRELTRIKAIDEKGNLHLPDQPGQGRTRLYPITVKRIREQWKTLNIAFLNKSRDQESGGQLVSEGVVEPSSPLGQLERRDERKTGEDKVERESENCVDFRRKLDEIWLELRKVHVDKLTKVSAELQSGSVHFRVLNLLLLSANLKKIFHIFNQSRLSVEIKTKILQEFFSKKQNKLILRVLCGYHSLDGIVNAIKHTDMTAIEKLILEMATEKLTREFLAQHSISHTTVTNISDIAKISYLESYTETLIEKSSLDAFIDEFLSNLRSYRKRQEEVDKAREDGRWGVTRLLLGASSYVKDSVMSTAKGRFINSGVEYFSDWSMDELFYRRGWDIIDGVALNQILSTFLIRDLADSNCELQGASESLSQYLFIWFGLKLDSKSLLDARKDIISFLCGEIGKRTEISLNPIAVKYILGFSDNKEIHEKYALIKKRHKDNLLVRWSEKSFQENLNKIINGKLTEINDETQNVILSYFNIWFNLAIDRKELNESINKKIMIEFLSLSIKSKNHLEFSKENLIELFYLSDDERIEKIIMKAERKKAFRDLLAGKDFQAQFQSYLGKKLLQNAEYLTRLINDVSGEELVTLEAVQHAFSSDANFASFLREKLGVTVEAAEIRNLRLCVGDRDNFIKVLSEFWSKNHINRQSIKAVRKIAALSRHVGTLVREINRLGQWRLFKVSELREIDKIGVSEYFSRKGVDLSYDHLEKLFSTEITAGTEERRRSAEIDRGTTHQTEVESFRIKLDKLKEECQLIKKVQKEIETRESVLYSQNLELLRVNINKLYNSEIISEGELEYVMDSGELFDIFREKDILISKKEMIDFLEGDEKVYQEIWKKMEDKLQQRIAKNNDENLKITRSVFFRPFIEALNSTLDPKLKLEEEELKKSKNILRFLETKGVFFDKTYLLEMFSSTNQKEFSEKYSQIKQSIKEKFEREMLLRQKIKGSPHLEIFADHLNSFTAIELITEQELVSALKHDEDLSKLLQDRNIRIPTNSLKYILEGDIWRDEQFKDLSDEWGSLGGISDQKTIAEQLKQGKDLFSTRFHLVYEKFSIKAQSIMAVRVQMSKRARMLSKQIIRYTGIKIDADKLARALSNENNCELGELLHQHLKNIAPAILTAEKITKAISESMESFVNLLLLASKDWTYIPLTLEELRVLNQNKIIDKMFEGCANFLSTKLEVAVPSRLLRKELDKVVDLAKKSFIRIDSEQHDTVDLTASHKQVSLLAIMPLENWKEDDGWIDRVGYSAQSTLQKNLSVILQQLNQGLIIINKAKSHVTLRDFHEKLQALLKEASDLETERGDLNTIYRKIKGSTERTQIDDLKVKIRLFNGRKLELYNCSKKIIEKFLKMNFSTDNASGLLNMIRFSYGIFQSLEMQFLRFKPGVEFSEMMFAAQIHPTQSLLKELQRNCPTLLSTDNQEKWERLVNNMIGKLVESYIEGRFILGIPYLCQYVKHMAESDVSSDVKIAGPRRLAP